MPEFVKPIAEWAVAIIELVGIVILAALPLYALLRAAVVLFRRGESSAAYKDLRQRVGRGILLGLEFLVAADIIHTVAIELTFETVGVLAIIVLIRTFLSFTLEAELEGRWPWQAEKE